MSRRVNSLGIAYLRQILITLVPFILKDGVINQFRKRLFHDLSQGPSKSSNDNDLNPYSPVRTPNKSVRLVFEQQQREIFGNRQSDVPSLLDSAFSSSFRALFSTRVFQLKRFHRMFARHGTSSEIVMPHCLPNKSARPPSRFIRPPTLAVRSVRMVVTLLATPSGSLKQVVLRLS